MTTDFYFFKFNSWPWVHFFKSSSHSQYNRSRRAKLWITFHCFETKCIFQKRSLNQHQISVYLPVCNFPFMKCMYIQYVQTIHETNYTNVYVYVRKWHILASAFVMYMITYTYNIYMYSGHIYCMHVKSCTYLWKMHFYFIMCKLYVPFQYGLLIVILNCIMQHIIP